MLEKKEKKKKKKRKKTTKILNFPPDLPLRTEYDLEGFFFKNDRNILIFWSLYHLDKWIRLRKKKKKWFGNPILGHFPPKYAQNCPSLKGYVSLSYQLTIKWFGHSIVYRFPDNAIESFFEIYKEHSHRTESRNGRFTHGVFVTNNQISKYLESFSKKGLY